MFVNHVIIRVIRNFCLFFAIVALGGFFSVALSDDGYAKLYSPDREVRSSAFSDLYSQMIGGKEGAFNYSEDQVVLVDSLYKAASTYEDSADSAMQILCYWWLGGVGQQVLRQHKHTKEELLETKQFLESTDIESNLLSLVQDGFRVSREYSVLGLVNINPLNNKYDHFVIDLFADVDADDGVVEYILFVFMQAVVDFEGKRPVKILSKDMVGAVYSLFSHPSSRVVRKAIRTLSLSSSEFVDDFLLEGLPNVGSNGVFDASISILKSRNVDDLLANNRLYAIQHEFTAENVKNKYLDFLRHIEKQKQGLN